VRRLITCRFSIGNTQEEVEFLTDKTVCQCAYYCWTFVHIGAVSTDTADGIDNWFRLTT